MAREILSGINPGDVIQGLVVKREKPINFRVRGMTLDGRVIISPGRSKTTALLVSEEKLLNGGDVDDKKLGRLRLFPLSDEASIVTG